MDEKRLGRAVQAARNSVGKTQQQLCYETGISFSTLAKIERGAIKSPSFFSISKICKALNISIDQLIDSSEARPSKVSKSGIEFVFFDINGVIVRFFQRSFSLLAERAGVSPDSVEAFFWKYNDSVCRGEVTLEFFNQKLAEILNMSEVNWQDYYMEGIDTINETRECMLEVASEYPIGIISNIFPGFISELQAKGIIPNIPGMVIIDSSEVGSIKPEVKIFEIAQERSGKSPEKLLLIDDSRPNIIAAGKLGWHVLWFEYYSPAESISRIIKSLE